ncbi:DDE-type integrase/transposase/recombinase [Cupriavidus oxalaticus]|uniref:DDE-type integrase/transposase/recombinase n=1 Tax=Cupriavidus oxalaticus TaxID=96344 RepID=UPI003F7338C7
MSLSIDHRNRWARLRFSVVGPLLASPPGKGELQQALQVLAAKIWRHPITGADVQFGVSTIERWFYRSRHVQDPVDQLKNRLRDDCGHFVSLSPAIIEALVAQYRQHPGWTMQLHYDNLQAATRGGPDTLPSYTTVCRYLKAHGLVRKPTPRSSTEGAIAAAVRRDTREVRSYEVDHGAALWHLDFHHGSRKVITPDGQWHKPMLLCVMDDHSRLVCHLQWFLDETTASLVHGVSQACMKRGLPRAIMTDNGSAMMADEFVEGLASLGILHQTTLPYSPYQNGKQERFWAQIESRLMAMLEGEAHLTLDRLNLVTQAWTEQEYHRKPNTELEATPLQRYLSCADVARPCPEATVLRRAFCIRLLRRQRRADGTFSLDGRRFVIPSAYRHLEKVCVRYARWDLSQVELVDERTGAFLAAVFPLDKSANADGQRGRIATETRHESAQDGPAPLLRQLLAEHAATGLPPAYLPTNPSPQA